MVSGTRVRILLARHGETVFNVEGRWQGQTDSPLTERGLAQAQELGRALSGEPLAAVYSSDLGRAYTTALQVAAPHCLTVRTDRRLREIDTGGFTGKAREQIDADYPGARDRWAAKPASMRLPGGETLIEAQTRALAFFADTMPAHLNPAADQDATQTGDQPQETDQPPDQAVVVISHGAVCQTILVDAMGGTVEDLWLAERMDNCQISRLDWTPSSGLKLIQLRDIRHLSTVGMLQGWRTTDEVA